MATLTRLIPGLIGGSLLALMVVSWAPKPVCAQSPNAVQSDSNSAQPAAEKPTAPAPASASSSDSSAKPASSSKSDTSAAASASGSSQVSAPGSGHYEMHADLDGVKAPPHTGDYVFDRASETFPAFCKDWERKLHDRELNNLENVSWKDQDGWKTTTYVAYSPIKTCACKRSTGGVPIGELTYQETEFYLSGRTVEEARHSPPKPVGLTNTTEIFRWDRTKWDDGR